MGHFRRISLGESTGEVDNPTLFKTSSRDDIRSADFLKEKIKNNRLFGPFYKRMAVKYRYLRNSVRPHKSARVFIKKGISRMEFFKILNNRNAGYVLLRWWENLPEIPEGEDLDILVWDKDRDLMDDLVTFADNGTGNKCDIYTVRGSKYGAHKSLPYFQANLAETLLKTRQFFRGAYVPSPETYFASLSYHALFHKGRNSGIPGFDGTAAGMEHDYKQILEEHISKLNLEIKTTVIELFNWLKQKGYAPAEDTLSKLAEIKPELAILQKRLYSDSRGGNLMVFVIRERLLGDGLLEDFTDFLEKEYSFDVIAVRELNPEERITCTRDIRGGKWDKGPFRYSGGPPVAMVVAYDYHPLPLSRFQGKKQPRMTNKNLLEAKVGYRERMNHLVSRKTPYNGVHSSDNEQDAWDYISLLEKDFPVYIEEEVEKRRKQYSTQWSVLELLSKNDISKVELIKYGDKLAVKKTFRHGKDKFLQREIYAAKELSQDLKFIPSLLLEGSGFLILPFLENKLKGIPEEAKEKLIASKGNEIFQIICSLHSRGLTNLNFTRESLIITPGGKLFCTGFSYLQRYALYPPKIEEAYEISGIPKVYPGDYPLDSELGNRSYKKVWEPLLGPWQNHLKEIIN